MEKQYILVGPTSKKCYKRTGTFFKLLFFPPILLHHWLRALSRCAWLARNMATLLLHCGNDMSNVSVRDQLLRIISNRSIFITLSSSSPATITTLEMRKWKYIHFYIVGLFATGSFLVISFISCESLTTNLRISSPSSRHVPGSATSGGKGCQ